MVAMGHVVLGAPPLARYHLHERLLRVLRQRGHRVSVLATAAAARTFWARQGEAVVQLADAPTSPHAALPLQELAPRRHGIRRRRFANLAAALEAWFLQEQPDLLLLDQDRGDAGRLLQFVARRHGCRVLWLGDGLLAHTLQVDDRGIDGDAALAGRPPRALRAVARDDGLLAACLAHALAQVTPFALPRAPVRPPTSWQRIVDAATTWWHDGAQAALHSLSAWRDALPAPTSGETAWRLPPPPFLAVLLQDAADPRLAHDAPDAPAAAQLVRAAAAASHALGCDGRLAVVAPPAWRQRRFAGVDLLPAAAAPEVAATALATVTVNHPAATIALLAGTPVAHLGRAAYGVRGVAHHTQLAALTSTLQEALRRDRPSLRARTLSWLFGYGHVWCSPTHPDHNGILGLAQAIETRLGERAAPGALRHRHGPSWPLAQPPRRQS